MKKNKHVILKPWDNEMGRNITRLLDKIDRPIMRMLLRDVKERWNRINLVDTKFGKVAVITHKLFND